MIKQIVNALFSPLGLRVIRKQTYSYLMSLTNAGVATDDNANRTYYQYLGELQHCFIEYVFPHIPYDEKRNALLHALMGTSKPEALWILSGLYHTMSLAGDICEFGCAQGLTTALMAHEILPTTKHVWVFDSFEGLPKPTEKDVLIDDIFNLGSIEAYAGEMSVPIESVKSKLSAVRFPAERTHLIKGFIETTIQNTDNLPKKVSFAYVDFDFYEPIKVALDFLHTVLVRDGYIIVDDYGFFSAGAQAAVDEFLAENPNQYTLEIPPKWMGAFAILRRIA